MDSMIVVRPKFDEASKFSYMWAERLMDQVGDKIRVASDLGGSHATRSRVENALKEHREAIFVFYNHGTKDGLVAQGGSEYVIDKSNDHMLKGRIVYTMACEFGKDCGVDTWRKGAEVVVCYVDVVAFTVNDEKLFCRAFNSGLIAYVNGERDWRKIKQIMIEEFNKAIEEADDPWSKMWLRWDRDILRVYAENVDVPESKCFLRKIAVKLLGSKLGWKLSRIQALGWMSYLIGFGIALHDYAHQVWELKGTVISLEGGYVGFLLLILGFVLMAGDHVKWLRK